MNKYTFILMVAAIALAVAGCNSLDNLTEGIANKSISGSGTFFESRAGLDKTTQTPELLTLFVWGDYNSVAPGDEIFRYEESSDSSVFNASAQRKNKKVFFASGNKKRMDEVIAKFSKEKEN